MINLAHVARSSRLAQPLTINRRQEVVDQHGEVTTILTVYNSFGVVTAGPNNSLMMDAEQQHMPKSISVVTPFKLRGPAPGYQPDIITWQGDNFKITKIEDYTPYGEGWVQAEAESFDWVDKAPG